MNEDLIYLRQLDQLKESLEQTRDLEHRARIHEAISVSQHLILCQIL